MRGLDSFINTIRDEELRRALKSWLDISRWLVTLYIILLAAATIFYINNSMDVDAALIESRNLSKEIEEIKSKNKELISIVTQLKSADRIIPYVEKNLGMISAEKPPEIIEIEDE